jgi:hypothetical protein
MLAFLLAVWLHYIKFHPSKQLQAHEVSFRRERPDVHTASRCQNPHPDLEIGDPIRVIRIVESMMHAIVPIINFGPFPALSEAQVDGAGGRLTARFSRSDQAT